MLLEIDKFNLSFHLDTGHSQPEKKQVLFDVSLTINPRETVALVGESGSGKSVTALSVLRLLEDSCQVSSNGVIRFEGKDVSTLLPQEIRALRGNRVAMIFQEPMTSLNPVFTIGDQLSEMFILHRDMSKKDALDASIEMLAKVQIPAPEARVKEYPHQLSGGMRQRAMIAMALSCDPEILIADEPTTALDVTVQAQILDLILQLKDDFNTGVEMITHDLGVIAETADSVVVMYAGRVVEQAETVELFENTLHPYTTGLLNSTPVLGQRTAGKFEKLNEIKGMVPSLYNLPKGCKFRERCPKAMPICSEHEPLLTEINDSHAVRCWLHIPH